MPFTAVAVVVEAEKHFHPKTPKRWTLVMEYTKQMNDGEKGALSAEATVGLSSAVTTAKFECYAEHCEVPFMILSSSYTHS